jgi:hypothetical protein
MGTLGKNFWKRRKRHRRQLVKSEQPPTAKTPQPIGENDYKAKQQAEEIPRPLPRPDKAHII